MGIDWIMGREPKNLYKGKESINMILVHVGKPHWAGNLQKVLFCFLTLINEKLFKLL